MKFYEAEALHINELQDYQEQYQFNQLQIAMRHALCKHPIDQIAYVNEAQQSTQHRFSLEIPTMKATDQMKTGRCWIFAGCNVLRESIATKYKIDEFSFSQNYVAFYDKLEKINYMMTSVISLADAEVDDRALQFILQNGIQDGGQWDMFVNIIKKYGIVPKEAMPETYQSSNTGAMNRLINTKMRQFAANVRSLHGNGMEKEIQQLKKTTMQQMHDFLCTCFGVPPQSFSFEYIGGKEKKYMCKHDVTPMQFFEQYVGDTLDQYVSLIHAPTADKPYYQTYTVGYTGNVVEGKPITYLNVTLEELKKCILAQLGEREIVWFGADVSHDSDAVTGTWDDKCYDYLNAFDINFDMSKEHMLQYRQSAMNHAMVLCGVNLEGSKPTKWKVENSWGSEKGNHGYYVMSDSWFDLYVYQAVINKKYLSKKLLKYCKITPITLHPWDPMSTLAD